MGMLGRGRDTPFLRNSQDSRKKADVKDDVLKGGVTSE